MNTQKRHGLSIGIERTNHEFFCFPQSHWQINPRGLRGHHAHD